MNTHSDQARTPEVLAPGTGHHLHFLDHLATVKVRPGDHGALSVVEFTASRTRSRSGPRRRGSRA